MNNKKGNISVINAGQLNELFSIAGEHKWILLAVPFAIYAVDKLSTIVLTAIEQGYEIDTSLNAEGTFQFNLKPKCTVE